MNYGKFQYQKSKRAHEAKKHQKQVVLKEVKFRPKTEEHDFQFKKNHIVRFLGEGNKAKATVVFRGREMTHQEIGRRLMDRLVEELKEVCRGGATSQNGRLCSGDDIHAQERVSLKAGRRSLIGCNGLRKGEAREKAEDKRVRQSGSR